MKKPLLSLLLTFLFTSVFQKLTFCQIDPCSNNYSTLIKTKTSSKNTDDYSSLSGIVCNPNTFFALDNAMGEIQELSISGSNAVFQSLVLTGANNGIGFCNNLNGGSFSPTFYSADISNQPNYYDGTSWVNIPGAPSNLYSQAGNGNTLVYTAALNTNKNIVKYNGSTFNTIYASTGARAICVADLAVDNNGNIWFMTTPDSTSLMSDSLIVISQTGSRVASYYFVFDCTNAYGAFILNNTYYIGFGPVAVFANSLIPISFDINGNMIIQPPVNMPGTDYSDLESCNPGLPLSVSNENKFIELSIYPNPFSDQTTISFNREQNNTKIKIIDILGKEVRTQSFSGKQLVIEKGEMKAGVYFIKITDDENKITKKKIIIQ